MDTRTAFALLGVPATAPVDAVRDAYRDLVKVWHPDRFGDDPRLQAKASDRLRELNDAYRVAFAYASTHAGRCGAPPDRGSRPASSTTSGVPPPARPAPPDRDRGLPFDAIWRTLFWAGTCGVALFIVTAPEGFFARGTGRGVGRPARASTAAVSPYAQLPDRELGDADLLSHVRGTWVVVENAEGTWLPAGSRVDVQRGRLSCRTPAPCDAKLQADGASRLRVRGASAEEARDVEVWFAGPTKMLWMVRPAGTSSGKPLRLVLHAQGEPPTTPAPGP